MVRKKQISAFSIIGNFFAHLTDNICDDALDMANGILNVEDNWPHGTYCQWLISAQDNSDYVTLEFQNFKVRNTIAFTKCYLIMWKAINQKFILDWVLD